MGHDKQILPGVMVDHDITEVKLLLDEITVICSSLIVTAKANKVDPYYYLKYLFEKMPMYLYETGKAHLPEIMPWSNTYKRYETSQRKQLADKITSPGNEKPHTLRKRDAAGNTA